MFQKETFSVKGENFGANSRSPIPSRIPYHVFSCWENISLCGI